MKGGFKVNNKEFLLSVINIISNDKANKKNWRGTLSAWIKC